MRRLNTSLMIICMSLFVSLFDYVQAFAQQTPPPAAAAKTPAKKKTAINFDDQLVTGDLRKPELFYLLQKKQFNFGRLIKLRENFLPEMRRTGEEVRRGGE